MANPAEKSDKMSLTEADAEQFAKGREKLSSKPEALNPIKEATDAKVEEAAADFSQSTASWWSRTKDFFSRAANIVQNEKEISKLDAQLEAIKKAYQENAGSAGAPEKAPRGGASTEKKLELQNEADVLFERLKGTSAQKMVKELYAYKEKIGDSDEYGQIGDVQFDERIGQLRINYADGSSLRKFPSGRVMRVHEGGELETIESPYMPKKPKAAPDLKVVPESAKPEKAPTPDVPFLVTEEDRKAIIEAIDAAKSSTQFRAYLMANKHLLQRLKQTPDDLAHSSDTDLEKTRLLLKDEIDGGIRAWEAALAAEMTGESNLQEAIDLGVAEAEAEKAAEKAEQAKRRDRLMDAAAKDVGFKKKEEQVFTPEERAQLNADAEKLKPPSVTEAQVVSAEPNWEKITKDAEALLKTLSEAGDTETVRQLLEENGFATKESLANMSTEELERERAKAWDEIAARGGIVVDRESPILPLLIERTRPVPPAKAPTRQIPILANKLQEANMQAAKAETAKVVVDEAARAALLKQALEAAPAKAENIAPQAKVETAKMQAADAKENPLQPAAMPAIVEALKTSGKKKDGKFGTPGGFRDALLEVGFKLPADMMPEDIKTLHDAYKKAAHGKKKP
ncbi:MAG: hypothetical protein QY323_01120 [Patescibacteria group bacterium]|nr:MAG: hypothetical protein QY323_01120 [Patescibacteria group bacterium]